MRHRDLGNKHEDSFQALALRATTNTYGGVHYISAGTSRAPEFQYGKIHMGVGVNATNLGSASPGPGEESLKKSSDRIYRFGAFELKAETGELSKRGIRVRLQSKPFQVLKALLERPGEVLTREELFGKLWPAGTFVDFESGLNTAVNRLRVALGDSAESPHFVETLPRLGYRFIGPVEMFEEDYAPPATVIPTPSKIVEAQTKAAAPVAVNSGRDVISSFFAAQRSRFVAFAFAILAVAVLLGFLSTPKQGRWSERTFHQLNCAKEILKQVGSGHLKWSCLSRPAIRD